MIEQKSLHEKEVRPRSRTFLSWRGVGRHADSNAPFPLLETSFFLPSQTSCNSFRLAAQENTLNGSTKYPTVWLGTGDGWLYIHSATSEHRKTIEKVWLRHAIYSIV